MPLTRSRMCLWFRVHIQLAQRLLTLQNQGGLKMAMNNKYDNVEVRHPASHTSAVSLLCRTPFPSTGRQRRSLDFFFVDVDLRLCTFVPL